MRKYAYIEEGRNILVLKYNEEVGMYDVPDEDVSEGILIRHTVTSGTVSQETDEIPVNPELERAIEYYVRKKLAENDGNPGLARYYESKFRGTLDKALVQTSQAPPIVKVGNWGIK